MKFISAINKATSGMKTYTGLLMMALPTVAVWFGYNLSPEGANELVDLVISFLVEFAGAFEAGGIALAGYGRLVAKAK